MISIRRAQLPEAALIADLSRKTFYDTFSGSNSAGDMEIFMREKFSRSQLIAELLLPSDHFFIAWDGDTPVGYTRLRENNNPPELEGYQTIEIARLYAVKEAIGTGVGKALMQNSLDFGRELNKKFAWLGVWEHNETAIRFYKKWGFEQFSQHPFVLGNDVQNDWLMKKQL
ncbi:MAG: GNAT family N-acetyltransferase [Chitinophagaceae bacterium]|nr:MAG: GNAT family N-acetyltransferase [Chitinophagaceae bacterium]